MSWLAAKPYWLKLTYVKEAYRMIPVHPHDQHLLRVRWNDSYYVDRILPFRLHSALKIFSAVADALQWI